MGEWCVLDTGAHPPLFRPIPVGWREVSREAPNVVNVQQQGVMPQVRANMEALGPEGHTWLALLDERVERARTEWGLELGYSLPGGRDSLTLRALRDGEPVVLKITLAGEDLDREVALLTAAQGRGYVRLLEHHVDEGILLLESLGTSLESQLSSARPDAPWAVVERVASTVTTTWDLPVDLASEPTADTYIAATLAAEIRELSEQVDANEFSRAINRALAYAEQRLAAMDPERLVLVHGKPHPGNIISVHHLREGAETGYVLIDPVGFRCEPEYDLGVLLREGTREILAAEDSVVMLRDRCARLAEDTNTDAESIWQWSYVQRVASGLRALHAGERIQGRLQLQTAVWLISRRPG